MRRAVLVAFACALGASTLRAQGDFANRDHGTPFQVEDARAIDVGTVEARIGAFTYERIPSLSVVTWTPAVVLGILAGTELELALPLARVKYSDGIGGGLQWGYVSASLMHVLHAEAGAWPALGARVSLLAPVINSSDGPYTFDYSALLTRSMTWGRVHATATATHEANTDHATLADVVGGGSGRPSWIDRWSAGVAADHVIATQSLLVGGEYLARRVADGEPLEHHMGAGLRKQVGARDVVSAGIDRRFTRFPAWTLSLGFSHAFGARQATQ